MTYVKFMLYLEKGQHERLCELAYLKRTTMSALIREAVREFLAKKGIEAKEVKKEWSIAVVIENAIMKGAVGKMVSISLFAGIAVIAFTKKNRKKEAKEW